MLLCLLAASALLAGVAGGARGNTDRQSAEATLSALERQADDQVLAKQPMAEARRALERASQAQAAGNEAQAALMFALAREWAETARDLVRAVEMEQKAAATQKQAAEAERKAVRARALVEESLGRRNRAEQRLKELEAEAGQSGRAGAPAGEKVK
jgi:hypothetical protein